MKAWIRAFTSVGLPLTGIVISLFGYQLWMAPAIRDGFRPGQTLVALVPFTAFPAAFFAHTGRMSLKPIALARSEEGVDTRPMNPLKSLNLLAFATLSLSDRETAIPTCWSP